MSRIFVIGSFNVDHVWHVTTLPVAGATLSGRYTSGPGGKGFNQAVAARRAGAEAIFICALGQDDGGRLARMLADADALTLRAEDSPQPTGTAGIFVDSEGRNCIVVGPGANASLTPTFVATALTDLRAGDVVVTQLESPRPAVLEALDRARQIGATTILNPAPANVAIDPPLLDHTDILTPNETEFAALLARHLGTRIDADTVSTLDKQRLHDYCRELLPTGTVVVTLGVSGCFVSHPQERQRGDTVACYRVPVEPAHAVDTTGAGDAFNGALAASLAVCPQRAFDEHVRFASRYAARSTEQPGAALAMPRMPVA